MHKRSKNFLIFLPPCFSCEIDFGEVAQDIYDRSVVYVGSILSAQVELKDLKARIVGEVVEVIRTGQRSETECITIFQSMGEFDGLLY